MGYVIGMDGGGTKTKALLVDSHGHILASSVAGPTNPNTVSENELRTTMQSLFNQLKSRNPDAFLQVTSIFAGISGAGSERTQIYVKQLIEQYAPEHAVIRVEPDTINALYSGTYGEPGIVQICGTGSITYGINRYLQHDRVGGWGYLLGDEGSGYDIGKRGISAALKCFDGSGSQTMLLDMLYDYFKVTNGRELIDRIYQSPSPKEVIAPIAKVVFQAYANEDAVANSIMTNVMKEISANILALYEKLFEQEERVKVVLCGGIFSDPTILPNAIKRELDKINEHITIIMPKLVPVGGSVIGAFMQDDKVISQEVLDQLMNECSNF